MKRVRLAMIALAVGVLVGCASTSPRHTFEPGQIDPNTSLAKVDAFVVIFDDSASMGHEIGEVAKVSTARDLATAMLKTAPELDYSGAVRTFGQGSCVGKGATSLAWGPAAYSTAAAVEAIGKATCTGGNSPLSAALDAAAGDLGTVGDRKALIIVSDGLQMGHAEVASASALRQRFGNQLCIYAIQIGDNVGGTKLLRSVVDAADCGSLTGWDELASAAAMEGFVREALVEPDSDGDGVRDADDRCPDTPAGIAVDAAGCPLDSDGDGVDDAMDRCADTPAGVEVTGDGCPLDSDGDGVPDYLDRCPDTPAGVQVDTAGCPLDSDGDGVTDNVDKCPDTPKGTPVDATGCPIPGITLKGDVWRIEGDVLFDFNKATIRADAEPVLAHLADYLQRNTGIRVVIMGYTDSVGSEAYNLKLSKSRAEAAKANLVHRGVDATRLSTAGKGEADPVAPNDTAANRALNRRVEFSPLR